MSDISIPGVNSRFNTESMVQELVDAESVKLERLQAELEVFETEKKIWQEMNLGLSNLRESARSLYSFENPFNERNAESSNERLLTATADRDALEGTTEIMIIQVAQADRLVSDNLSRDMEIPQGVYEFTVGEESLTLRFRGGSVSEFSAALNRRNPDLIRSNVVNNTSSSQVILIESMKEGSSYTLGFEGDARQLALDLGWMTEAQDSSASVDMSNVSVQRWTKSLDNQPIAVRDDALSVGPGAEFTLPFPDRIDVEPGMVLRYEVRLTTNENYRQTEPQEPPGPSSPESGSVSLRDASLPDISSQIAMPTTAKPEPQVITEESELLYLVNRNSSQALPEVDDSGTWVTVEVPLDGFTSAVDAMNIRNPNTIKDLEIRNVEIVNPETRGDMRPKNAIATARDAVLELDGIRIERTENVIDDVIPGVRLELKRASDEPVEVTVEPDRELVKNTLIEWVARYNQIVRDVNILTRNDASIIDEIEYFTDEERETYTERLGMFQGDSTLNTLKNRLQTITMSAYPTLAGSDMALLSQIGISTNASRGSGSVNMSQLRGYLEINEEVLDQALASDFDAVKELFGVDTDGDLLIDQGVAYAIDSFVQPFVQIGGILASKTSQYDSLISSQNDEISDYEEHLEDYEAEQRRQFGVMESAVNSLESSSQGLQGLSNQNNNN